MKCNCLNNIISVFLFILFFEIIFSVNSIKASTITNKLMEFSIEPTTTVIIDNQGFDYAPEITPEIFKVGGDYYYVVSTQWTFICKSPTSILSKNVKFERNNCKIISKPENMLWLDASGQPVYMDPSQVASKNHYSRNYAGYFSMHYIPEKNLLIGIQGGENSNSRYTVNSKILNYQNTFKPQIPVDSYYKEENGTEWLDGCYSGYDKNGNYKHCWQALSVFTNAGFLQNPNFQNFNNWNETTFTQMGPILWHQKNPQTVTGLYHPTSFYYDNNLFVYTIDLSPTNSNRNYYCSSASKTQISGTVGSWKFSNLLNGAYNKQALPTNFTKDTMLNFKDTPWGERECLFKDQLNGAVIRDLWFSVAKVKNSPYFLGLQLTNAGYGNLQLSFRISKDLISWSPPTLIQASCCNWGIDMNFYYPRLLNSEGITNLEIDLNNFYILGNNIGKNFGETLTRVSMDIKGDMNDDHIVKTNDLPLVAKALFIPKDDANLKRIDTNANNTIDTKDLISIIKYNLL